MDSTPLTLQLAQIESLQERLRQLLLDDEPEGLDALLAEKRARLEAVLAERNSTEFGGRAVYARLLRILRADHDLQALISSQLAVLSTELRKTSEAQRLTGAYLGRPAVAAASGGHLLSDMSL
jgi:hypothetical protein